MKKADLQAAQAAYDDLLARARKAETEGDYASVIEHSVAAWEFLDGMMRFERKYESAEFSSVPCVELVLRYAPLLFYADALDRLEDLLRTQRSIEKNTSQSLKEKLESARELMSLAHRLWSHIEENPGARQDGFRETLGGDQDQWRWIAERWEACGLVVRLPEGGSYRVRLTTCLDDAVLAKCSVCGLGARGRKSEFLAEQTCPKCEKETLFAMLVDPEMEPEA